MLCTNPAKDPQNNSSAYTDKFDYATPHIFYLFAITNIPERQSCQIDTKNIPETGCLLFALFCYFPSCLQLFLYQVPVGSAFHFSHCLSHNPAHILRLDFVRSRDYLLYDATYLLFGKLLGKIGFQYLKFRFFLFGKFRSSAFFELFDTVIARAFTARETTSKISSSLSPSSRFFYFGVFDGAIKKPQRVSFETVAALQCILEILGDFSF